MGGKFGHYLFVPTNQDLLKIPKISYPICLLGQILNLVSSVRQSVHNSCIFFFFYFVLFRMKIIYVTLLNQIDHMKTKFLPLFLFAIALLGCSVKKNKQVVNLDKRELINGIRTLSHDSLEGRNFASEGNQKGQLYLANSFKISFTF